MYRRFAIVVMAAFALCLLQGVALAGANTWPLESAGNVLLNYGAAYGAGAFTHRGVDIGASEGADVLSPAAGTVAFAGRVPAGEGATCFAITVALEDGRRVTLMPLSASSVKAGQQVAAGAVVGSLASAGDDSSSATHVHVSLRRGDTYLDPMTLLVAPAVTASTSADEQPSASPVTIPKPADGPANAVAVAPAVGAAVAPGVAVAGAAPAQSPAAAPGMVNATAAQVAKAQAVQGDAAGATASMPQGVTLASDAPVASAASVSGPARGLGAASAVERLAVERASMLESVQGLGGAALRLAGACWVEIALLCVGVVGDARRRSIETPSAARVRPVGHALAAAADRCYTRWAHFLPRAQLPSQSRGRHSPREVTK